MEALGFDPTPFVAIPWTVVTVFSVLGSAVAVWLITCLLILGIGAFRYLVLLLIGKEK